MRHLLLGAVVCCIAANVLAAVTEQDLARHGIHQITLTAERDHANPFQDVDVTVEVTSPSGTRQKIDAFWDGGRTWRARVAATERGEWTWRSTASTGDKGLTQHGSLKHEGKLATGPLRVADSGTHFVDAAGEPFFWLGDTAWNGALRSTDEQWEKYLSTRKGQHYNVIQFVTTQWRGGREVVPQHAFEGNENITVDPAFFQKMDRKLTAIEDHGLVPSPVMLWALNADDPGQALAEKDATRLAKYQVARWGAFHPAWLLGGDGRYNKDGPRWNRIGQAAFGDHHEQLVTMHPSGANWVGDLFADQKWFDYIGYQSGHGDSDTSLKWLTSGPPAQGWKKHGSRPIINLEPNYEGHPGYQSKMPHPALHVRRAGWWSNLVTPPAGLTYGNNEIWVWNHEAGPAENHKNIGVVQPWDQGLEQEGLEDMTLMRRFFESGPWWDLRPAQHVLIEQPGEKNAAEFVAVAQTRDQNWTVAYLPVGTAIRLKTRNGANADWFDPRTGERKTLGQTRPGEQMFAAPDDRDWVLSIRTK